MKSIDISDSSLEPKLLIVELTTNVELISMESGADMSVTAIS